MATQIAWEHKIQIDPLWVDRQLDHHFHERKLKITVRGYTPKISGTTFSCDDLVSELGFMVTDYVLSEDKKAQAKQDLERQYSPRFAQKNAERHFQQIAQRFFGRKDPETDGKYGELLLFAIVESILGSKMVAHKIVNLTNYKDQSKGGDGVFLGNYNVDAIRVVPALFIGESKIMRDFSTALEDALDSLNRFHAPEIRAEFNATEFIVARDTMMADEDYEEIYNRLSPGTEQYKSQIMVHPVLLMFNTNKINTFEKNSLTSKDLEEALKGYMKRNKKHFFDFVTKKISSYPEVEKVFVDFFIFPFNDISKFRNAMYYNIHGVSYQKVKDEK